MTPAREPAVHEAPDGQVRLDIAQPATSPHATSPHATSPQATSPQAIAMPNVALLTLDRPAKLNALTTEMTAALARHVETINADDGIRAVVLTGTGRAFCAGSDITELAGYSSPWKFGSRKDYGDILRTLRKPVIAAVNGHALGGGLELALACDIRIAAGTASFAAPEIKLGWIGGSGQSALLAHCVGPSNAALMLLTGEPVDAATALRWGLVSEVVAADGLLPRALELAGVIASRAPIAAETAKINLRAAYEMPLTRAIDYERHLQTICFATADAAEGRAAFAERRDPAFRGR